MCIVITTLTGEDIRPTPLIQYSNNTEVGTATVTVTGLYKYYGSITLNFTIEKAIVATGTEEADSTGSENYKITSNTDGNYEVEYVSSTDAKASKVTIPDTVTLADGTEAKVTSVAAGAFKNNSKVKTVVIGNNVETISKNAFQKCKKLKNVTLGSGVTTIDKKAFQGCSSLKTLTIKSSSVTKIAKNALKGIKSSATIKVGES